MCATPGSGTRAAACSKAERWHRRLTVCLFGCLISAFMVLTDYLVAGPPDATTDNTSRVVQPVLEQLNSERDHYKWKFIVCFPIPVDVMPVSGEKRRLGGAGLISTLDRLTVNDLLGPK